MKSVLKPALIVAAGFASFGALTSCTKEARQEAAAENAAETAVDVTEDYCELLESIKDKESAGDAIEKMDGMADKFAKVAEEGKKAGTKEPDAATMAKTEERMKALQERMTKAAQTAMPIIASDPELMKAFQTKQLAIASKMQEAAGE